MVESIYLTEAEVAELLGIAPFKLLLPHPARFDFADPGMSIAQSVQNDPSLFNPHSRYPEQNFWNETNPQKWTSVSSAYKKIIAPPREDIIRRMPTARVVVASTVLYYKKTASLLFPEQFVLTSSRGNDGQFVLVGCRRSSGIQFHVFGGIPENSIMIVSDD